MNDLVDPRPLEPEWVRSMRPDPSGLVEWCVVTRHWNKTLKMYDSRTECHEGTPLQFLSYIGGRTLSGVPEPCMIVADTRQALNVPDNAINIKYCEDGTMYWSLEYSRDDGGGGNEDGSDISELLDWMVYLTKEQVTFTLELDELDPTPEYSEIGSMF